MISKVQEKARVIELRRKGMTYREILEHVPVAKSSVSLWLKDFPLSKREKDVLRDRKKKDMTRWKTRAAASLRQRREERDQALFKEAKMEFLRNVEDAFFQVGIALYWAEGAKRTNTFSFINSDVEMSKFMLHWVRRFLTGVNEDHIRMRVFTHKAFEHEHHESWWAMETGVSLDRFGKTIFKTQNGLIVKKRPNYKGCVRIELGKVAYLKRMKYWQQLLIEYYRKQL